jgi:ribonuclease III
MSTMVPANDPLLTSEDDRARELAAEHPRISHVQRLVGWAFTSRALLLESLTHRSWHNEHASTVGNNERLEFLGDAVLSLVVAERLFRQHSDVGEGVLTQQRAARVSTASLAKAARASGLLSSLRAARGINKTTLPDSVAADVIEAVIGAAYLDGGLVAASTVIDHVLQSSSIVVGDTTDNAKRALQERLQGLFGRAPTYANVSSTGPAHGPRFVVRVLFDDDVLGEAEGATKKAASEQAAAMAMQALQGDSDDVLRARWSRRARS